MNLSISPRLAGRFLLLAVTAFVAMPACAQDASLKSIVILDFELIDDQKDVVPDTTVGPRLPGIGQQLRQEFAANGLYRVIDIAPATELITKIKSNQDFLSCNGCEVEVAQALNADRVAITWVHKVSDLIVNLNVQIEDGKTGEILLNKSANLQGIADTSFKRGISYMVRSMLDKHQGNR